MITGRDKWTGLVLSDRIYEINKMNVILNDQTEFQTLSQQKDCTERIEQQLTGSNKLLEENNFLTPDRFEDIKPVGTHIPIARYVLLSWLLEDILQKFRFTSDASSECTFQIFNHSQQC